ncbi:MAG: trypsin-like peptidase domain-containing protein [Solirubrobacterales bacterium]|nr:trypsin-like peptidase domain-containing protein [Solirubrobacterales bacterium]
MNDFDQTPQSPASRGGSSAGLSFVSAVIGGAIVAAIIAVLIVTGVIGDKETVVTSSGGVAATTANASGEAKTVGAIYKQASPAVVSLQTRVASGSDNAFGQQQEGTATGTGFVISDDGYIVTNDHVVAGFKGDVKVTFGDDKTISGKVIGQDPSNDIAIVKVDKGDHKLTTLPLGDSSKVAVGDPVVAIGNPFGLNQSVTTGIVSALQRTITAPNNFSIDNVIQTDAAINPGNSGGPLLNGAGEVIGVNSQIATGGGAGGGGNVGIGFAVPADTVKKIIPQLEKNGKVEYAYLGVSTGTLPTAAAERLKLGTDAGAVVACVVKGGPGEKAGLTAGGQDTATIDGAQFNLDADVITKVAGKDVKTSTDVQKAVLQKKPGDEIEINVTRNGDNKTLKAKLGTRPTSTTNNCSDPQTQP